MLLAIIATLVHQDVVSYPLIIIGLIVGQIQRSVKSLRRASGEFLRVTYVMLQASDDDEHGQARTDRAAGYQEHQCE